MTTRIEEVGPIIGKVLSQPSEHLFLPINRLAKRLRQTVFSGSGLKSNSDLNPMLAKSPRVRSWKPATRPDTGKPKGTYGLAESAGPWSPWPWVLATLVGTAVPATAQTRRSRPLAPVPHVVGIYLDKAEAAMDWRHFSVTVFGGALFGIVAPADWQVCAQFRTSAHHVDLSVAHWACS